MQTANILLSLAGDHGNTVPKYAVPASEIALLREIHGAEAVKDVEPTADVEIVSHRAEIARLKQRYGKERKEDCPVERLYPGAAARVFEDLAELDIPEEFYKAEARVKAPAPTPKKPGKGKAKPAVEDDGIGEMDDGILG